MRYIFCFLFGSLLFLTGCGYVPKPKTHIVREGQTLYSISQQYKVPLRRIIEENNLEPPYIIKKNDRLSIPSAQVYVVKKGDTLFSIAQLHGVDLTSLARKNNLKEPWTLSIGQHLYLPASLTRGIDMPQSIVVSAPIAEIKSKPTCTSIKKTDSSYTKKQHKTTKKIASIPPVPNATGNFVMPVQGKIISNFGIGKNGRRNDGINIKAPEGTPIKASQNGVVAYANNELRGFGNLILVKHDKGWISAYAHTKDILKKKGELVKKGEVIAHIGQTGNVKSPQLHFELRKGTKAVNPMQYIKK